MDGESFDRYLNSSPTNAYSVVLFHASWCPFSRNMKPKFAALSFMFPQVKHITIEESEAMPSLFSRYGVHSLPSIIILNGTAQVRHHEQKDLPSLVRFYKKTTGYEPVVNLAENDLGSLFEIDHGVDETWKWNSMEGILDREPYLVFSVIFLLFRAVMYFFLKEISNIIEMWYATIPRLNLRIFGESRQLLGRALDLMDLKRMWRKLKLCKTNGARNAHVWASSSLASVSLGKRFKSEES
ncbi:5'-adenylylsulfate reductase-like 5 [Impatiens glandulifera]|uniref:5'-adenylylsulfate reductase-like 5 n=1 Tax=Impatiens glandulifera TaxID=253017 RepID=UPI001FB0A157|nr:5'-adenylylsulfate reductase-like 5 [Impatiens glandulifera]